MEHLKLLFSLLMDPFMCLKVLFSWVVFEDEGHPVDAGQRLWNNRSAKSRRDLTTKAVSLSFLSLSSTDFL